MNVIEEIIRRLTVLVNLYGLELWVRTIPETADTGEEGYLVRVCSTATCEFREYLIFPEVLTDDGIISMMDDILANLFTTFITS